MGKTLILSQKQLDEIIGGDSSYLQGGGLGNVREYPSNEISADGKTSDGYGKPKTGDEFAEKMAPEDTLWRVRSSRRGGITTGAITSEGIIKKKIVESNSQLENRFFKISSEDLKKLKEIYSLNNAPEDAQGRMTLKKIITDGGFKYSEAKKIKSIMSRMDEDSAFFQNLGGEFLYRLVDNQLKLSTNLVRRDKENMKNLGFDNVYQKPGGTKNSKNGKAHSKKA